MAIVNEGDKVKHKRLFVNGGLAMSVLEITDSKALCDFFEGADIVNKQEWFDIEDLEVIIYGDSGFRNKGE